MSTVRVRRLAAVMFVVLLLLQSACSTTQGELHPRNKARLGTIGVLPLDLQPVILEFSPALTRSEAAKSEAARCAALGASVPAVLALFVLEACHSEDCLGVVGAGLGVAVVGGILGGLYGSTRGALHTPTPEDIAAERRENLHAALDSLVNQQDLADAFLANAAITSPYHFILLGDEATAGTCLPEGGDPVEPPCNARLEMYVDRFGIDGSAAQEQNLSFTLHAKTRLFFPLGKNLLSNEYSYTSPPHAHGHWAADNGELLRHELTEGYRQITQQMIADMFD